MYDFHYNFVKKHFDAGLLFNDTDIFMKNFLTINIYLTLAIFQKAKFYDNQNEMVVGKMKDEYKGIPINIFVGLK